MAKTSGNLFLHYTRLKEFETSMWMVIVSGSPEVGGKARVLVSDVVEYLPGEPFVFSPEDQYMNYYARTTCNLEDLPNRVAAAYIGLLHQGLIEAF